MAKTPMTLRGAELLRAELHKLKTVERPATSQAIAEARAHGDLSENAEYDAARERQGFIEARIADIEAKLANAQVIDPKLVDADGRCVFGSSVDLEDEADIKNGLLSIGSPIARALIGKKEGDEVEVATPSGKRSYEITAVEYI